jgi:hypothetical protein
LLQAGLPDSIDDLVTVISRCKHLYHIREMGRIQESSLLSLADSAFEKAMSVSPKHQVARAEYGYLLMKTKPSDKDKRVTDLDVRSACLFYLNFMFAFNLVRGGSPEYSLELIDRAISRDPSVYNLLDKADVLKDLGKMKERRDILQEVTARTFGIVQKWSPNYRG